MSFSQTTNSQTDCSSNPWLLLIPTEFESKLVGAAISSFENAVVHVCGFGPIVPAARTMQLINQIRPSQVMLLGIAGSYSDDLLLGKAYQFSKVNCYGVGVGSGATFQTGKQMGWNQWDEAVSPIADSISLAVSKSLETTDDLELATVCSAAENLTDVEHRTHTFPDAAAEDMEGFAVAAACQLASVPLHIIRGISNRAGDRDKSNWQIKEALNSAVSLALKILREG
ncbi:MAG: futalosine hydrolase [Mariniblastus sp.]